MMKFLFNCLYAAVFLMFSVNINAQTPQCRTIDFEENFGTGTGRVCDLNGASTTYICNQTTQVDDGQYSISNISDGLNTGWHLGMEDHTVGDIDGRALYVNADFTPGEFYRRTITLTANSDFSFNAWITTVYDTDTGICGGAGIPSNVIFRIEDPLGNLIQEINTGDIQNGPSPIWQEFTINFNTGANTDIQLVLINNSVGGCGNDLAIDDITLTKEGDIPMVVGPPDLSLCDETGNGMATYDLNLQTPIILNGQNPADFNVSFHNSLLDAEMNINSIATPSAYINTSNPETVYVRIERTQDPHCYSVVNFDLLTIETPTLDLGMDQTLCDSSAFEIVPIITGNIVGITYLWSTGETTPTIVVNTDGIYSLTITVGPCIVTDTIEINISEPLEVDLGVGFKTCPNEARTITAIANDENVTYQWFLNGEIITGQEARVLEFEVEAGTMGTQIYSVIISKGTCTATDQVDISLYDVGNCTISQGISPNGSPGFNDNLDLEFLADRIGISRLQIFNRHGLLVYNKNNYINEWIGQSKNDNALPTGTYFYVLDLLGEDPVYGTQATGWIYLNQEPN